MLHGLLSWTLATVGGQCTTQHGADRTHGGRNWLLPEDTHLMVWGRPPKQHPTRNGAGGMVLTPRSCHHNGRCDEKQLAPVHLDMPIFKLTDPNLWRFDVQEWLNQYQEESMMPHIYNSLRGYPGRWCTFQMGVGALWLPNCWSRWTLHLVICGSMTP